MEQSIQNPTITKTIEEETKKAGYSIDDFVKGQEGSWIFIFSRLYENEGIDRRDIMIGYRRISDHEMSISIGYKMQVDEDSYGVRFPILSENIDIEKAKSIGEIAEKIRNSIRKIETRLTTEEREEKLRLIYQEKLYW